MINIGIICEGPTDYIILKNVINKITGENNCYFQLQPESNLKGEYGNGWKGVWKWCIDNAPIKEQLMKQIQPTLDILVLQMDGDVSRKEKVSHCHCKSVICGHKGKRHPLECDAKKEAREACPIKLPCKDHEISVKGYIKHLEYLIGSWIGEADDICVVIPCDSTEAWIVAAYDSMSNAEQIKDPWLNIISRKKYYHDVRISGNKKSVRLYEQFANIVCANWEEVAKLCVSAKHFERKIMFLNERFRVNN